VPALDFALGWMICSRAAAPLTDLVADAERILLLDTETALISPPTPLPGPCPGPGQCSHQTIAEASRAGAVRVREGGEIVQEISAGDTGVYAAVLGGADGGTLPVLAARVDVPGA
jgi:hypothetical protein